MAKTGTLPHYLYSNKISEGAEVYSGDMVRPSDTAQKMKKSLMENFIFCAV